MSHRVRSFRKWRVRDRAQRGIRMERRVSLLSMSLLLLVGFLQLYTISKHILADLKFSRWVPRVIRELRRDLSVSWTRQLAKSKSMPSFKLHTQLPVNVITLKTDASRFKLLSRLLLTQAVDFNLSTRSMVERSRRSRICNASRVHEDELCFESLSQRLTTT